jgi:hypothetical protein
VLVEFAGDVRDRDGGVGDDLPGVDEGLAVNGGGQAFLDGFAVSYL